LLLAGVLAATLGIGGAVLGAAVMLWSTGQDALLGLIGLIALAQIPVWLIDAAVSALVIATLGRVLPRAFDLTRAQSR
jgi:cobalt/nickel transport system permease protein